MLTSPKISRAFCYIRRVFVMETIPTKFRCHSICRSDFMEAYLARFRTLFPWRQLVVTIASKLFNATQSSEISTTSLPGLLNDCPTESVSSPGNEVGNFL